MLISATHSGAGKTSISLALAAALKKRGLAVQTFKVGPDYIDPQYLASVSGRPCYNLDGWMMGEDYVRSLFAAKTQDTQAAVTEGVMGLFDGDGPASLGGSAAQTAMLTGAPVILVVDAKGMGGSVAALVGGFANFSREVEIAGVIANNCGSQRHGEILREALAAASLPPLIGAIPRGAFPALPSRHLGLISGGKARLDDVVIESFIQTIEKHCDIGKALDLTRITRPGAISAHESEPSKWVRIGVARDEAFHFYYQDTLDELARRGMEIVPFSPLSDNNLPEGIGGLYLGGGYPEEHAEALCANESMLEDVRRFALDKKGALYAECGGLMYLSRGIRTLDGKERPMAGILPAWTRMRDKYRSLGYVEAKLENDSILGKSGAILRGHRFHYSEIDGDPSGAQGWPAYSLKRKGRDETSGDGFANGKLLASYVHTHLASNRAAMDAFISSCGGL
ncbi:MAG: cobyrinate a,c-diamide synthase [Nitrospinae bacterium]|nr:cobyrinate a,c-diamide synthase [Nitrospinota bacterium]